MKSAQKPQVYERYNYNGEFSILASKRDHILLVLNLGKTQEKSAKILGIGIKTLTRMQVRHRIKRVGVSYVSDNKWD